MEAVAGLLQDYLERVMRNEHAALDLTQLPEEFQAFGRTLVAFSASVTEITALAKAISKGNLNVPLPPPGNEMAASLKALHASLKHLTWQTQQVARGDYQQRVDFMGDFSNAFNTMVEQLEQRRLALLDQIRAVMQNQSLYEVLSGQIEQQIILTDADTSEILYVSRETGGAPMREGCSTELCRWLARQTEAMQGKNEISVVELELTDSGTSRYYSVSIHPMRWDQRNAVAFVLTDVSTEREQLRKFQNIANADTLTQLYNRRYGMETLGKWLSEGRRFILCFVDIDNLKFVNDLYGHAEGDAYILSVADAMRTVSPDAVVCRIGGDEFMLLVENWSMGAMTQRLEALRGNMLDRVGAPYERSISYGLIPVEADNRLQANDLLNAADERMYEYKRAYKLRHQNRIQ